MPHLLHLRSVPRWSTPAGSDCPEDILDHGRVHSWHKGSKPITPEEFVKHVVYPSQLLAARADAEAEEAIGRCLQHKNDLDIMVE